MNLETRIEMLEARQCEREAASEPRRLQRADYDAGGHVVACEQFVFPRNPPDVETLGPMLAGMLAMVREPNSRDTCPYGDCEKRVNCCADGRPTNWMKGNSRNS